jgi:prepilin-type N-terminal cleavage/methylation domain-containing protein
MWLKMTRLKAALGDHRGMTLIEMLVAMAMSTLVLGAVVSMLVLSQQVETRDARYAYAQDRARAQLDDMVSEIRQATDILSAGPNYVDMNVDLNGSPGERHRHQPRLQLGTLADRPLLHDRDDRRPRGRRGHDRRRAGTQPHDRDLRRGADAQ